MQSYASPLHDRNGATTSHKRPIASGTQFHRDSMGRVAEARPNHDTFLSPRDGRLRQLVVQSTDAVRQTGRNASWSREIIKNATPKPIRIATWVYEKDAVLRWLPGVLAILVWLPVPTSWDGKVRHGGNYDPLPYRYWGYPKAARNVYENEHFSDSSHENMIVSQSQSSNPISERPLEPRWLCFLRPNSGIEIVRVEDWKRRHGERSKRDYVFVSYTSTQFQSDEDFTYLHQVGERAARVAGTSAYWIGCSCMGDPEELEEDVYRISDVVRGSHSLIVVVGPSYTPSYSKDGKSEDALRDWASRVWCWPEVLLSPRSSEISIYSRGGSIDSPNTVQKRDFAALAFHDAPIARQLLDHYEGSLILSPLELISIALECLSTRKTDVYLPGDISYALMGLLRRRPKVDKSDSAFQAFSRLSLANDNNLLLERLICFQPKSSPQPWHVMEDAWAANLWDVYPTCQVSAIAANDTVLIDGAHAAAIRWKGFKPVASLLRDTMLRKTAKLCVRSLWVFAFMGIILLATAQYVKSAYGSSQYAAFSYANSLNSAGAVMLIIGLLPILASPWLIRRLYSGKLWFTQAWFFGLEGYMPIEEIEANIFGRVGPNGGRLKWTSAGSPLSRHVSQNGECVGVDPTTDPEVRDIVERARTSAAGEEKVFTLVDTYTMTVTMFVARRPPIAVVLCGSEGGMQRALMCSYDCTSQTLYREAVLRMETTVLERMSRVPRFRFGLNRDGREEKTRYDE